MDEFTTYGTTFEEAKANLEKVLRWCQDYNRSLNSKKFFMMMEEGVVLGHFISPKGIQVNPTKIEIINTLPTPKKVEGCENFF